MNANVEIGPLRKGFLFRFARSKYEGRRGLETRKNMV
jgi:hypothetical protein